MAIATCLSLAPKVLIIDDEEAVHSILSQLLAPTFQVVSAFSAEDATRLLESDFEIGVALLDLGLGATDGMDLLRHLSREVPGLGVIVLTGQSDLRLAVEAMRLGAYDFLLKPPDAQVLRDTLDGCIRSHWDRFADPEDAPRPLVLADVIPRVAREHAVRFGFMRALCRLAEFRDPETGAHLDRVAVYATLLARRLGHHRSAGRGLADALFDVSPLHDIGKVAIPDAILLKPGPLTPDEFDHMKRHTVVGGQVVSTVVRLSGDTLDLHLRVASEVTRFHHERCDGLGYPMSLKGDEIPLSARIVAVADVYDACTSVRTYRAHPLSPEETGRFIIEGAGTRFDPDVVHEFIGLQPAFSLISAELSDETSYSIAEVHSLLETMWKRFG